MDDETFLCALAHYASQMREVGFRGLLVLSGEATWSAEQASALARRLPGDWLWVGEPTDAAQACPPRQLRSLLGREFHHAIFDARRGFDAEALAALAGTLTAGSWLVMLTAPAACWRASIDADSIRWSDSQQPIATPHFLHHVLRIVNADPAIVHWRQSEPVPSLPDLPQRLWLQASGAPQAEQAEMLTRLRQMRRGIVAITAPRGRGKSALAGMFIRDGARTALVTAPAKVATGVMAQFAGDKFRFMAPDAIERALQEGSLTPCDWLIVDEAAAIPAPLLSRLMSAFPGVLLTTTVQGYEGTGRGFLLKFCARFPALQRFTLATPVRWASGDPLERALDELLLFDDQLAPVDAGGEVHILPVPQSAWRYQPARMANLYRLLAGAHYRTSPLDLRRMMDAPGQGFYAALSGEQAVGALWMVAEGGLDEQLSRAVWAGFRRPRGNLVAQSLAAHGGSPLAATLRGLRVSRIAVHPQCQRQTIGRQLIEQVRHQAAEQYDYLSVSFGFTPQLWRFWQRCGFALVRIGSHREASSGCYTAMALLPLNRRGAALADNEHQRLCRDSGWLQPWIDEPIPVTWRKTTTLTDDDWQELAGFAFAHRPLEACTGSLQRLLLAQAPAMPLLEALLRQRVTASEVCRRQRLSGQKALLAACRAEAGRALYRLDEARARQLAAQILQLQFFQ
ncbi:tRNA(Met) cytidine acetyltransferase TmcA [Entomohabitans teleogrylli]|uniref:tRNA(Met) cytidine acetyltransferase TmcA n=1 Tax=Entomohabitans teleogrylli TaxID=1384589 RepID=UPI00073DB406|nr:GNAT family N-acetyltransferase [Entomohabitans teleogrylli]